MKHLVPFEEERQEEELLRLCDNIEN